MLLLRYLPITLYVPSTAFAAVFIKVGFGDVTPFLVTFSTFAICWLIFLAWNAPRLGELARTMRRRPAATLKLNLYTLLSWLGAFACIKLLTGSVELLVFMSAIPLASTLAGGEWPRLPRVLQAMVAAIFVCSLIAVVVHPAMAGYGAGRQVFGYLVGVGAGAFGALYIVLSGREQKAEGLSSADLICIRLPLLLAVTFALSATEIWHVFSPEFLGKAALLSAVAVIIPAYSLQLSIGSIGSVPTSVLMPLVPIIALGFEWGAGLPLSGTAVAAMAMQCLAIMWVSFARRQRGAAPAPERVIDAPGLVPAAAGPKPL
jgi:drug/metabolite transporter (DMT)-like permease